MGIKECQIFLKKKRKYNKNTKGTMIQSINQLLGYQTDICMCMCVYVLKMSEIIEPIINYYIFYNFYSSIYRLYIIY